MNDNISHLPRERPRPNLTGNWTADPERSEVGFAVRLLGLSKVRGRFTGFDVTIDANTDGVPSVDACIELTSIDTGNERRDKHLRSADFLATEAHPRMSYRSTDVRPTDDGWLVDGELTLHDITRLVPLAVTVSGAATDTAADAPADAAAHHGDRTRLSATAHLKRSDFGIDHWTGGGAAIGDVVSIHLEIEAVRRNRPQQAAVS